MAEENELIKLLRSTAQGANNSIAGNVTLPVDYIALLLRQSGLPMPNNPVMGTAWQQQQGLLAEPENKLAGLIGDGLGTAAPFGLKRPVLKYP